MKEQIHLFTPVSEGLPEKDGFYIFIIKGNSEKSILSDGMHLDYFYKRRKSCDMVNIKYVTHYLDLSKLTTKSKAEELARDAYYEGRKTGLNHSSCDSLHFITQNINKL